MAPHRWWGVALAAAIVGCRGAMADRPPTIRYGEEACAQCRMLITEARYAAAFVASDGTVQKFDDIECMRRARGAQPAVSGRAWVHDYETGDWMPADAAIVVHSRQVATAMGSGLVAFERLDNARRFAEAMQGTPVQFEEVVP